MQLKPDDKKKDRVLFVSNNSYFSSNKPIPKLTIEGGLTIDSYRSPSYQTTIQADKYKNLSSWAVVQAGSGTNGAPYSETTSGKIFIQGDLTINDVGRLDKDGKKIAYIGNAIYVGQESVIDLTKNDGTIGNVNISNSDFSGDVIDIGGSSYDSSAMGAEFTTGNINISNTNGQHGIHVFGGTFKSDDINITGGSYTHDLISFTGHKQGGDDNLKTNITTNNINITNSSIKGSAIYVGTSGGQNSQTGTVNAQLGNITIDKVDAIVNDGQGFIHFNKNSNTNISLGDVKVTHSVIRKNVAHSGSSGIRFTENQSVSMTGNGEITFENIEMIQQGDPNYTGFWSDQISLVFLEHSVNNLNQVNITNLTNDRTVQGSNPNTSPFMSALHIKFSGEQKIKNVSIDGVSTHDSGIVYGIYQNSNKNILSSDTITIKNINGENDAYGLYLSGKANVKQNLIVETVTGSKNTDRYACGVYAKDSINIGTASINGITGYKAIGLETLNKIQATNALEVANVDGVHEATGILLKSGGTLQDVRTQSVQASNATGIKVEKSTSMNNLFVENVHGKDSATGANLKGKSEINENIEVQNIKGSNAIGLEVANGNVLIQSHVKSNSIGIHDIRGDKTAYGLFSDGEYGSTEANSLTISGVSASNLAVGIATREARLNNLAIGAIESANNAVALLVLDQQKKSSGVTVNEQGSGTVQIDGNVIVDDRNNTGANLSLNLTNSNSFIKGAVGFTSTQEAKLEDRMTNSASSNLKLNNESHWFVTDNSYLTNLTLDNKATLDLVTERNHQWHKVTTKQLAGQDGIIHLGINLGTESVSNIHVTQVDVTGKAEGRFTANLAIDGREMAADKFHSSNWLISQGGTDSSMSVEGANEYSGNGMVTTWGLAFVANGEEDKLDTAEGLAQLVGNTTGKGEGKWYLVRNDEEIVDPSPDPKPEQPGPNAPSEIQQITNMGISATQALSFAAEIDDLRTRLGEVRYGAQDGAWVKAGYAKEHADGYNGRGFSQKTHDLHIGLDRLVAQQEDRSWLLGGALRYAKSDQEGFAAAMGGTGELEQYSAKLYATYMHEKGSYADFVLQAGRYAQDLSGLANDKVSAFSADYKTWGYGASVEVGHMFSFGNDLDDRRWTNHAFVEPQLQLSYFRANGKDYTTSTGMAVSQGDADFLTGRAGVVVGKKFNYGTADDLDKRYFQIALKGGVKYEFKGDQTIGFTGVEGVTKHFKADEMDGARYYYGLTTDWQLGDNLRAYATIEREEGDHYTKDIDATVGLKYAF